MHDFPESTFWGIMFFICEMEGLMIGKSAMQDGKRPEYIPPNIWPPQKSRSPEIRHRKVAERRNMCNESREIRNDTLIMHAKRL